MLLWVAFAVLTAIVAAALLRPLTGSSASSLDATSADGAVYRDQLSEIDADVARGLIGEGEAKAARTEVARRLLKTTEASAPDITAERAVASGKRAETVLRAAVGFVVLASIGLYVAFGSPALPGLPHSSRLATPVEKAPVMELIARVEERLRDHPEDGQGWDVIAPIYLRLERFGDARESYANAMRLLGETPGRLASFAEAAFRASDGVVTPEVRAAAERLKALAPDRADAAMWLALGTEQDGATAAAIDAYKAIIAREPANSIWAKAAEARVTALEGGASASPQPGPSEPGPSEKDIEAAGKMSAAERSQLVGQMVERLSARLKANGSDLAGWMQLMNSYVVLGRKDDAARAFADAKGNFKDNGKALGDLDVLAKSLGIGS